MVQYTLAAAKGSAYPPAMDAGMNDRAIPSSPTPLPIAVLLSGTGRTLANLLARIARGTLPAVVRVVVGTKAGLGGQAVAEGAGVPYHVIARRQHEDSDASSAAIWEALAPYEVRLVVLAGFLQPLRIPPAWQGRVVNIHPALLPSFGGVGMYGRHVHAAVLAHGCKVSGCTVHLCDDTYDTGAIIAQQCVSVYDDDTPETLAARVFAAECTLYPQVIAAFAAGRIRQDGQRVTMIAETPPSPTKP